MKKYEYKGTLIDKLLLRIKNKNKLKQQSGLIHIAFLMKIINLTKYVQKTKTYKHRSKRKQLLRR